MVQADHSDYWMRIGNPQDVDGIFALWYRIGHRSEEQGEIWTRRTNHFKDGQPAAIRASLAVIREASSHLGPLLGKSLRTPHGRGIAPEQTLFIPALTSEETASYPQGKLTKLAAAAAAGYGTRMSSGVLRKGRHESLSRKRANAAQRREILGNAGYRAARVDSKYIVVVDDVSTTGQTLSTIATAIKASNVNATVFGIVLAKQESLDYLPFESAECANARVPGRLDQIWKSHARQQSERKP